MIYNSGTSEKLIELSKVCPYLEAEKIKSSKIRFDLRRETQPESVICDAGFDASFDDLLNEGSGVAIVTASVDKDFDHYIHQRAWFYIACEGCNLLPGGFNIAKQIKVG